MVGRGGGSASGHLTGPRCTSSSPGASSRTYGSGGASVVPKHAIETLITHVQHVIVRREHADLDGSVQRTVDDALLVDVFDRTDFLHTLALAMRSPIEPGVIGC